MVALYSKNNNEIFCYGEESIVLKLFKERTNILSPDNFYFRDYTPDLKQGIKSYGFNVVKHGNHYYRQFTVDAYLKDRNLRSNDILVTLNTLNSLKDTCSVDDFENIDIVIKLIQLEQARLSDSYLDIPLDLY